jgi:hypothetical protein
MVIGGTITRSTAYRLAAKWNCRGTLPESDKIALST